MVRGIVSLVQVDHFFSLEPILDLLILKAGDLFHQLASRVDGHSAFMVGGFDDVSREKMASQETGIISH